MNKLEIINEIRQLDLIEIYPNATFQTKNKNKDNKMIRIEGKTELFVNPTVSQPPLSLYTNAETKIKPVITAPIITVTSNVQTPRPALINNQIFKKYTEEELTQKGITKIKLQDILRERKLKISGNKDELILRILSNQ